MKIQTDWLLPLVVTLHALAAAPAAAQADAALTERLRTVLSAGLASSDASARKNYREVLTVFCRDGRNIADFFSIPERGIGITGWPYVQTEFLYLRAEELRQADLGVTSQWVYSDGKTGGYIPLLDLRMLVGPPNTARKITSRELDQASVPLDAKFKASVESAAKLICRRDAFQKTGDWIKERFRQTGSGIWE